MKKILAIGGGENGREISDGVFKPYETEPMDKQIIKLTGKENPNFLFLAHSHAKSVPIQESYYQTMQKIYGEKFSCNCRTLKSNELKDKAKVHELVEWADIIYEGGGDTLTMIQLWKEYGFDKILEEAWNKGKVICGVSAGAICWFDSCNSDSIIIQKGKNNSLISVDGLGWINLHITPHCDEAGREETTKQQLKENKKIGLMLSNCSAIEIIDDKYRIIFSKILEHEIEEPYAFKAYWDNDNFVKERLEASEEYYPLSNLLYKK